MTALNQKLDGYQLECLADHVAAESYEHVLLKQPVADLPQVVVSAALACLSHPRVR